MRRLSLRFAFGFLAGGVFAVLLVFSSTGVESFAATRYEDNIPGALLGLAILDGQPAKEAARSAVRGATRYVAGGLGG